MKTKGKILSVRVESRVDDSPDLSWIGEYSNDPGKNAIDRQERGDMQRGEYRYCNIELSGEDTGNPESVEQDYQRLEAFNQGQWWEIGVVAKATVQLRPDGPIQTLHSGGLWGIESDSEDGYMNEVKQDELAALADELAAVGFGKAAIKRAIRNAEDKA